MALYAGADYFVSPGPVFLKKLMIIRERGELWNTYSQKTYNLDVRLFKGLPREIIWRIDMKIQCNQFSYCLVTGLLLLLTALSQILIPSALARGHELYPWMTYFGPQEGIEDSEITALQSYSGLLYVGTAHNGVFTVTASGRVQKATEFGALPGNKVTGLTLLGDGLAILTNGGAILWKAGQTQIKVLVENAAVHCLKEFEGRVFLGTDQGVEILDSKFENSEQVKRVAGKRLGRVVALTVFDGLLYAGTSAKGCFIYDPATGQWSTFSMDNGLTSLGIRCLYATERYFFVGHFKGVEYYDRISRNWYRYSKGVAGTGIPVKLASNIVDVVTSDGVTAWFGTDQGLTNYVLDVSGDYEEFVGEAPPENAFLMPKKCPCRLRWNNLGKRTGLSSDRITALADFAGDFWVGTADGGLNRISGFYVSGDGWNELYKIVNIARKIEKNSESD